MLTVKRDFDDLAKYLAKRNAIGADERVMLQRLLARVKPFAEKGDSTALAMQVQIAAWLDDAAALDASYEQILAISPRNETALTQWVAGLTRRCEYERAIGEVNKRYTDMASAPKLTIALVETLVAANRLLDAKSMLDGIADVVNARPDLQATYKSARQRVDLLTPRWQLEESLREAERAKDDLPRVEIVTSRGPILIELFEDQAPNTTAAFIGFVESGLYPGTRFHKRFPGLAVLGGDPNTKVGAGIGASAGTEERPGSALPGHGSPGYRVPDESVRSDHRFPFGATIGLAKALAPPAPPQPGQPLPPRTVENTAGSGFFILLAPAEHLDREFTMFGRVVDGFDVVAKLATTRGTADEIVTANVVRKRPHEYRVTQSPELPNAPELTILLPTPTVTMPEITRGRGPLPPGARIPGQPAPGQPIPVQR
ncbi:MAG: peptidylprolyl isomerase [Phycisphaerae bacterium]|nr:peptidylprolyl isomerase [Phycisphaerae bacterium]